MISQQWSKLSIGVLGNKDGKHCHWCTFHKSEDGEVHCVHKQSQWNGGDRIRCLDGDWIAKKCKYFELDKWYTDDRNYEEYFKK